MSVERVKEHLKQWGREDDVMEFDASSATVAEAAQAVGTEPSRIAKTLTFQGNDGSAILVVTAGDRKIDNSKFKHTFGLKAKMLSPDEVEEQTGYQVGGVCPFGIKSPLNVYLDESMKRFGSVYPACGSANSAIEVTTEKLFEYAEASEWVDVCKPM